MDEIVVQYIARSGRGPKRWTDTHDVNENP